MSKKASKRAARRQQQNRQRMNLIIGAAVIVVVVIAGLALVSGTGDDTPSVAQERLARDPMRGDPNAPVTVIEYASYSCTACRQWHRGGYIEAILAEYQGQVNFVYRDYPVISPAFDRRAAEMAQCAFDQDENRFWTLHDALFTQTRATESTEDLLRLGERVGFDYETLKACTDANTHRTTVNYDEERGRDLGLQGTPAFLVNGQQIYGATPATLREAINTVLQS
jgi:protein-disulfide isomerase